jgi:MbtH protein
MTFRTSRYKVVVNHEEQYSIIPIEQSITRGWREAGKTGTSSECLAYIEEVWTDMKTADRENILRQINR